VSAGTEHRKLAAIMFTDMVSYTALSQRNEALALELLEEHRRLVRTILPQYDGREVKTTGDGFLIEFLSALAAVQCAIDVQAAMHARNLAQPEDRRVSIRVGIHVGDVVVNEGDLHGDGVNLAARIEPLAGPGGICLSRPVYDQVANKLEAQLAPLGRAELKGIEGLMEVHRVVLPWQRGRPSRVGPSQTSRLQRVVPWALAGILAAAWVGSRLLPKRGTNSGPSGQVGAVLRKFELTLPQPAGKVADAHGLQLAIAPDGKKLAYADADGLWLRWLDRVAPPVLLYAGQTVFHPFWSPQSTDIGFFESRKLYRISLDGGRPMLIGTAPEDPKIGVAGGAWLPGEKVIFTTGMSALYEAPAQGGKVATALALAGDDLDFHHASPLPGGRGVLFVVHRDTAGPDTIALWTPQGQQKVLLCLASGRVLNPVYSPTGHILFERRDATQGLWAFPFSLVKLERTGEPFRVSDIGQAASLAQDGTLIFSLREDIDSAPRQLIWLDRSGKTLGTVGPPLPGLNSPRISPDGRRIVAAAGESATQLYRLDLWLFDVNDGRATPFTRTEEREDVPLWSGDGRTVVFTRWTESGARVIAKPADGMGQEQLLFEGAGSDLARGGKSLLVSQRVIQGKVMSGYVSLADKDRKMVPLPQALLRFYWMRLSPDNRWLAYHSEESGQQEVYVVDFPGFTNRVCVSRNGGRCPEWHPKGTELFFLSGDLRTMMSARVDPERRQFEEPIKLFEVPAIGFDSYTPWRFSLYDVAPDGERFLMLQRIEDHSATNQPARPNVMLVENWFEEFRGKK
jgi:class 3 adenylate cyclase